MYPLTAAEHLQLREKEGDNRCALRNRGRLAGQFQSEHERGHRADTAVETPDCSDGRNLPVYRPADSLARFS